MSERRRREQLPPLSAQVLREALRGGRTVEDVAREYGVEPSRLRREFRVPEARVRADCFR